MRYGNPSKKTKVITSLKGHSVEFPGKGSVAKSDLPAPDKRFPDRATRVTDDGIVFVHVPHVIEHEVVTHGMLPETEIEEPDEPQVPARPESPEAFKDQVYDAFKILVAAGERESFDGTGTPKPASLEKLLGYAVPKAEMKDLWAKFQLDAKDAG